MQRSPHPEFPKRLRTVLLYTSGHLGSAITFNLLSRMKELEIVAVVKARPLPVSRDGGLKLRSHLRRVGWRFAWLLVWQRLVQVAAYGLALMLPVPGRRPVYPGWWLARRLGVPMFRCERVNDPECEAFLRSLAPDLIVSAYFNQILKPHILAVSRLGTLNIHPGWLPAYRGAMSYFWALRNGEEECGVTLHWMDEGVDTGAIVARRRFKIARGATQQQALVKTAMIGSRLLQSAARRLLRGESLPPLAADGESAAYYPMPGSAAFGEYFTRRRFFRIRDVFRTILRPFAARKSAVPGGRREYVVLLHGILRTAASMRRIERALRREGYRIVNVTYPSRRRRIEELADGLRDTLRTHCPEHAWPVHFVTHSMGGLLLRYYLGKYERPEKLGRVAMLAPPSRGSEWADLLRGNPLYRTLYGPAGQQLGTGEADIPARLAPVDFELGIITGNATFNPFSRLLFRESADGTVSVARSKAEGMKDHLVIRATHNFIPHNGEAIAQILHFLEHGHFRR